MTSDEEASVTAAIQGLRGLIAMGKVGIATPADVSEPITCALMGWKRVPGRTGHDAEFPEGRIQIKYSMVGYVSCKRSDVEKWDFLAWVHAPSRLPKLLLLIPAQVMRRAKFAGGGTLHVAANWAVLRENVDRLRAWRFDIADEHDLDERVRAGKRRTMPPRIAISILETDLATGAPRDRAVRKPDAPARTPPAAARIARTTAPRTPALTVGRGDLSRWNGRAFQARWQGAEIKAQVSNGTMTIAGVKGVRFKSLSAAGRHLTGHATNGNTFWRMV